jgi:glycosyltransferase involved in cell wall biosynthesis
MVSQFDAYSHFNVQYAERVAEIYEPGDIVLVHNYELMLLPHYIRRRIPKCTIGFFLHVPFPSSEIFQELPKRSELLKGILGADLIAFNNFEYIRHFQNSCTRTLGLEAFHPSFELGRHCSFSYHNRRIALEICPAGIDPQKFYVETLSPTTTTKTDKVFVSSPSSSLPPEPSSSLKQQGVETTTDRTKVVTISDPKVVMMETSSLSPRMSSSSSSSSSHTPSGSMSPSSSSSSTSTRKKPPPLSSSSSSSSSSYEPFDSSSDNQIEKADPQTVSALVKSLSEKYRKNGCKLVLSIDRMDWCKGLPQKLTALECFFIDYPQWRGKVTFFVVVGNHPGGLTSHILQLRQTVNRLVGRVNGKFGSADYVPVHFIHRTLHLNEIIALYTVADAMLVTSIREGINLTALEFIACQSADMLESQDISDHHHGPHHDSNTVYNGLAPSLPPPPPLLPSSSDSSTATASSTASSTASVSSEMPTTPQPMQMQPIVPQVCHQILLIKIKITHHWI